ncbi:hypothetical protein ACJX0J_004019 [Zea mays]
MEQFQNGKCASFILISIFSSLLFLGIHQVIDTDNYPNTKYSVFSKIHYDNEKYFYISDQNDQEYPNLINQYPKIEARKLTRTIWFSEKTPGTLHQNVPEDIVNFENLREWDFYNDRKPLR